MMGIAGKWFITPHAVRQFQHRCEFEGTYEQALGTLVRLCETAHLVKEGHDGMQLWRTGRPLRCRLIVSHRWAGQPQLVTVLRGSDRI